MAAKPVAPEKNPRAPQSQSAAHHPRQPVGLIGTARKILRKDKGSMATWIACRCSPG
jgi:hypothetical protein